MRDFDFHRPDSMAAALELLRASEGAKLVAGGQSLIPLMKLDLAEPGALVSVDALEGFDGIVRDGDRLLVGAGATHASVAASSDVRDAIPALADLAGRIGDPQVRNCGTLGGSIAHADPAADYPAALLALDAVVRTDRREIDAADWFVGMFMTPLERDEIIVSVSFRVPQAAAYRKFPHPASRFAVVGVMVARHADGARVGVTGAAPSAFRVHDMEAALDADFSPGAIASIDVPAGDMIVDDGGSAEYRAHLVGVLARRAVAACA